MPEPLLYCSDISIIGTEFYLMQHVQVGPPMWKIFSFSLLQAAFKLFNTFLLESYSSFTMPCDININNPLIFLKNASYQRLSLISASPGLISHFVKIFSSIFNLLLLFWALRRMSWNEAILLLWKAYTSQRENNQAMKLYWIFGYPGTCLVLKIGIYIQSPFLENQAGFQLKH